MLLIGGALAAVFAACSDQPPSWTRLIAGRITAQYPKALVAPSADFLDVELDGRKQRIELAPIILQCNRGHADCERALGAMLAELGGIAR